MDTIMMARMESISEVREAAEIKIGATLAKPKPIKKREKSATAGCGISTKRSSEARITLTPIRSIS